MIIDLRLTQLQNLGLMQEPEKSYVKALPEAREPLGWNRGPIYTDV
jgi:hypothetical protein